MTKEICVELGDVFTFVGMKTWKKKNIQQQLAA